MTYYVTGVFICVEWIDGCILYFIHEPFRSVLDAHSAVTAVSDVTDMQLAKHSISGQEKQISAELQMFMLEEKNNQVVI